MLTVPGPSEIEILASRLQHSCAVLLMLSVLSMTMDLYTLKNVYSDFWCVIVNPDFFAFLAAASVLFCSARSTRGVLRSAQYAKCFATIATIVPIVFICLLLMSVMLGGYLLLLRVLCVDARFDARFDARLGDVHLPTATRACWVGEVPPWPGALPPLASPSRPSGGPEAIEARVLTLCKVPS